MQAVPTSQQHIHQQVRSFGRRGEVEAALARLDNDPTVVEMKGLMITVLNSIETLRHLAPGWNWDNPVGDIGEYVACTLLGMTHAGSGQKGFDVTHDGRHIQIKTMFKGDVPGYRGTCDDFMLFKLDGDGLPHVAYYGAYEEVHALSRYSRTDNKRMINLTKVIDMFGQSPSEIHARVAGYNRIIRERHEEIRPVVEALQTLCP